MNGITKIVSLSVTLILAGLFAYGIVMAKNDYSDDPDWCAMIQSQDRERSLNPISLLAYKWYLDKKTDVALRRAESQRKLLDGTYAKQVQEGWAKRRLAEAKIYDQVRCQNQKPISGNGVCNEPREQTKSSTSPHAKSIQGLCGLNFGDVYTNGYSRASIELGVPDDCLIMEVESGSGKKETTYLARTPISQRIYSVWKNIRNPDGTVDEYLGMLEKKYDLMRTGNKIVFGNGEVEVTCCEHDRYFSNYAPVKIRTVTIKALDYGLADVAEREAAKIKEEKEGSRKDKMSKSLQDL